MAAVSWLSPPLFANPPQSSNESASSSGNYLLRTRRSPNPQYLFLSLTLSRNWPSPTHRPRRLLRFSTSSSSSQENGGSGGNSSSPEMAEKEAEASSSAETIDKDEKELKNQDLAAEIKEKLAEARSSKNSGGFWGDLLGGVTEEVSEIEWPAFGRVLGTTGVVLAVIAGSSVALLTVNALLAEISDRVFAGRGIQDLFG